MLKMVDGTGIIGVDMICPLGVSTPQPPNYDRVEMEGTGILVLPNSLDALLERLELGGKTEQVTTTGVNLFDEKLLLDFGSENYDKTQSGSGFYYYKFPVSGTVTVSTKNANKNGEYLTVGIKPDGSDKTWLSHGTVAISKYKTLTPEDGNIYLGVNNNLERVKSMIQNTGGIIINEGSAAQPYEPYTGGKPSPSQEYQQKIKNSGKWNEETQKYEVNVKVSNKNLFDLKKTKNGFVRSTGDGFYIAEDNSYPKSIFLDMIIPLKAGQTLNISGVAQEVCRIRVKHDTGNYCLKYVANKDTEIIICFYAGLTDEDKKNILIEISDVPTTYEPYKEQTITLTSDRPITKWDRLVEQGGQIGWLYQSKIASLTGKEEWKSSLNAFYTTAYNFMRNNKAKCSHYVLGGITNQEKNNIFSIGEGAYANSLWVRDTSFGTIQDFKEHLSDLNEKGAPIMVVSPSAQTEFVPLPQSEQNAIRALKTYYPTTVITADGGELDPDIKVTYRKEI